MHSRCLAKHLLTLSAPVSHHGETTQPEDSFTEHSADVPLCAEPHTISPSVVHLAASRGMATAGPADDASSACIGSRASLFACTRDGLSHMREESDHEGLEDARVGVGQAGGLETVAVRRVVITVLQIVPYPAVVEFLDESNRILRRCALRTVP